MIDKLSQPYRDVKGVKQSIDYQEEQAVETVIVDYRELDFDVAKEIDSIFIGEAKIKKKSVCTKPKNGC